VDAELQKQVRDGMLAKGLEVLQSDTPDKEWVAVLVGPDGACLSLADTFHELLRRMPTIPCAYIDENGYCSCEYCAEVEHNCPQEDMGNWRDCYEYEEAS